MMRRSLAVLAPLVLLLLPAALPGIRSQDTAPAASASAASAAVPATSTGSAADERHAAQRARILEIARDYAEFEWQGDARNVLHGPDADGTYVDTPDVSFDPQGWSVDGAANHGMPYAWGGFTSIDEFKERLAHGLPAGQVPTTEHVDASRFALGLDCSGYVARCWDLPVKQSTRSLSALCYPLPDYDALQPGDILLLVDSHVVVFDRWLDAEHGTLSVFEAARLRVTDSVYAADKLKAAGFLPMRYKPLDARWVPMTLEHPNFASMPDAGVADRARQAGRFEPEAVASADVSGGSADATPAAALTTLAALPSPLADARPLEWARYRVTGPDPLSDDGYDIATLVASAEGPVVELQMETRLAGGTISTGTRCEQADELLAALLDFASSDEPLAGVVLDACTVTPGSYVLGERRFPARRIEAQLHATRVMRHQEFPVTLTLECVLSAEVPVHGVLEARVRRETVWRAEPPEQRAVSRSDLTLRLQEFGGAS